MMLIYVGAGLYLIYRILWWLSACLLIVCLEAFA